MTWSYTTRQGDTWDIISLRIYGGEMLGYVLLQANPQYMRMIILPAGLTLVVPQLPAGKTKLPSPPWARG